MDKPRRLLVGVFVICFVVGFVQYGSASPRYTLLGRAEVVTVDSSNLMKLRLLDKDRAISVRLLGVGSPRNRERLKHLDHHCLDYIERNNLWKVSRDYVKSLVQNRVVEVWARKYDPLDDKNRLLVYLAVPESVNETLDLNGEIIRNGMGFVTRDYVHVTFAQYKQLEEEARQSRKGIWRGLSLVRTSSVRR